MGAYHKFSDSLAVGHRGEELLLKIMPELKRTDGRRQDFDMPDGRKLELKTDSYDMAKSQNFFIELVSDMERNKPGGPEQALASGSTVFAYMYPKNGILFLFDTAELLARVQTLVKSGVYRMVLIPNKSWTTMGVLIPREVLKDLYQIKTFIREA